MKQRAANWFEGTLDAAKCMDFDRTIALLMDDRPGLDQNSAREIGMYLHAQGYLVHEITVSDLLNKDMSHLGFLLLIPHAQSMPIDTQTALDMYWKQGGHVLLLGGPLYGRRIERTEDGFCELPLETHMLDAVHANGDTFNMEGVAPTHKVFFENNVPRFHTEEDQSITRAQIVSTELENVLCPIARPHGIGYRMEHRNRMITLVSAMGEGGRAGGRRGAAAFLMLSNTRGHLVRTNGTRPGSVSATTQGSCVGGIGLLRQDLMNVQGAPELLLDMVAAMRRGVYLYEGGSDTFIVEPDRTLTLGARILSVSQDFIPAEVRIRILRDGKERDSISQHVLLTARAYTEVNASWTADLVGDDRVITELVVDGVVVDCIHQELRTIIREKASPEDFVRAVGDGFICQGKPWFAYGLNYWPLFYPSFDRTDYWMGWLDKANYDPLETERDLAQMADLRINLVCTRLDGDVFGRSMETLRDFIERCRRHGMKLMLSYPNATNPLYYQRLAVEKLMAETGLADDPVLFAHDISWELGPQPINMYIDYWDAEWAKWIVQRYGSVENAEQDWGVIVDRDQAGRPIHPPLNQFEQDGPWRVKLSAYRRFLDCLLSRYWNDAMRHLRRLDRNHLISYRGGSNKKAGGTYLTATMKHVDFTGLEGYSCNQSQEGLASMICLSLLAHHLSGGKPVTWMEFGMSLAGTSGNSPWEALRWNKETLSAPDEMLEVQRQYYALFFTAFKEAGVVGSAPWWYPGGFRRVERSDCGQVHPNGTLRPAWEEYLSIADWFLAPREARKVDQTITLDPDANAQGWGRYYLGTGMVDREERDMARVFGLPVEEHPNWGEGVVACMDALAQGKHIVFAAAGSGSTSVDMPMLAVGNTPLNGHNPPKHLEAEFNTVYLMANDQRMEIHNGDEIYVPVGAALKLEVSVGNLREATWLRLDGRSKGSVRLSVDCDGNKVTMPIEADTPYLHDAMVYGNLPVLTHPQNHIALRMECASTSEFGEVMKFIIMEQEEAK